MADRLAVIDHGKVIAEGTAAELKASVGSGTVQIRFAQPEQRGPAAELLHRLFDRAPHPSSDPAALSVQVSDPELAARALAELSRAGLAPVQFSLGQPSLDEVFLHLTGHPAEPAKEETNV